MISFCDSKPKQSGTAAIGNTCIFIKMNNLQKAFFDSLFQKLLKIKLSQRAHRYSSVSSKESSVPENEELEPSGPYLHRTLQFPQNYIKEREVWVENLDDIKEEKRGLVELHPKIFGTIPRLDIIHLNIKWQSLYRLVNLYSAKTRAEMPGSGRKPHPQKGLGRARQGSVRAPQYYHGGTCHGPRGPKTYFYMIPHTLRVHGLTSTLTVKHAQDDLHVVDNLNIPTDDSQFMLDLVKERNWGPSVLIVDSEDIMPRNITLATDNIGHINLMPVYSLNVYSMLKHETLVLTLRAVDEIEDRLLKIINTARYEELVRELSPYSKKY